MKCLKKFRIFFLTQFLMIWALGAWAEDWKGKPDSGEFSFGGLTGMGIVDGVAGFSILGTLSKKIISPGFVPDLNDTVSIEGALGPLFLPNSTGNRPGGASCQYGFHLRWDFNKDEFWTLYALGGVWGSLTSSATGGNRFELLPNFGVGAFYKFSPLVYLRGEVSSQLLAVGVNIPF